MTAGIGAYVLIVLGTILLMLCAAGAAIVHMCWLRRGSWVLFAFALLVVAAYAALAAAKPMFLEIANPLHRTREIEERIAGVVIPACVLLVLAAPAVRMARQRWRRRG